MNEHPPARVRVTSPKPVTRRRSRTVAAEIDAHSEVGEIYMSSLLGTQLRLAVTVLIPLGLIGFGLPALLIAVPGLARIQIGWLPLSWVLVGVVVFPVLVLLGWWYVRAAETAERDFTAAVEE